MRNFFTMLLISQGVPFIAHGDEFARTQRGNNNVYCQDNDTAWVDWGLTRKNAGLVRFVRLMIALRQRHFALSREQFVNRVAGTDSRSAIRIGRASRARWPSTCTAGTTIPISM
jgi:glycogen operon protein